MRQLLNTMWRTASPWLLAGVVATVVGSVALLRAESRLIVAGVVATLSFLAVHRWARSAIRLQDLSAELADLVDTVAVPVVQTDSRGTVTVWNRAAEEASGLARREVIGTTFAALVERLDPSRGEAGVELLGSFAEAAAGRPTVVDLPLTTPAGSRVLRTYLTPRRGRSDRLRGVVAVALDMTAEMEADRARAQALATERASQLKDEFLAAMSHELRTPLTAILGLSQIMQRPDTGRLNEQQLEYVREIDRSGQHLLSLINDILDLAKIEAGLPDIGSDVVDLGAVVADAVAMVRSTAEHKGLVVDGAPPPDPVSVTGDERRLKQVALNLLSNAVKFTDRGTVGVEWSLGPATAAFTVYDTGPGIPREKRALLFQPFQQVDGRLARRHGGTGLGLALSKQLVDLHGGTIEVDDAAGGGARFTVRLPRIVAPTRRPPIETDASGETPRLDFDVLVAEDDPVVQMMLEDALQAAGAYVHIAGDGAEAVRLAPIVQPAVVLMDIQMPVMDGLAATRRLKADPVTASIPVLAVSALAMSGDRERILAAGCDGYLAKPIDPAELIRLVAAMAAQRAMMP